MNVSTISRGRAALLVTPFVSLFFSFAARGQDKPANSPDGEAAEAPTATAGPAEPSSSGGLVERLPPSAYPEWTARGIPGGSLWFSGNMHGMPWPYYPRTGIGVSGYAWLDTGYENIARGNTAEPDFRFLVSQGRAVLRVTPTWTDGDFYVQGQTELVANKDQTIAQPNVADVDDLWVRFGQWRKWDVQVGRFEAYEVYHFGMAMDLNTLERDGASDQRRPAPDVYGLASIAYRQSGIGNVALHYYLADLVRIEVLGQFGFDTATSVDTVGARPAVVLDLGSLKLKAEGDVRKQFPVFYNMSKESRLQRGGSFSAQLILAGQAELGANVAYGLIDHYLPQNVADPNATMGAFDGAGSVTDLDYGGFINALLSKQLVAGVGANYNTETDQVSGKFTHLQTFGAVQVRIGTQLFIKLVGSYAKAHLAPDTTPAWDNTMMSGRLRMMYLF